MQRFGVVYRGISLEPRVFSSIHTSLFGKAEMVAKAARLAAELKFHDIQSEKGAALKRQESNTKKLQIIKELAATSGEIEVVAKIEEEDYDRDLPENEVPAEAVCNLENLVTTVSSAINAHTNVTFSLMPRVTLNSQQPSFKFLHLVSPPCTVKST